MTILKRVILLFLVLVIINTAYAETVTVLQPGIEGKDSYLREDVPDNNFGDATKIYIGTTGTDDDIRGLIEFNLSSIPYGADISSALLQFYVVSGTDSSFTLYAHRITANWTELGVTWNNRYAGAPWGIAGGTYAAASNQTSVSITGWYEIELKDLIQAFVNEIYENYGMILTTNAGTGDYKYIFSSDYTLDTTLIPKLNMTWDPNDAPTATLTDNSQLTSPINVGSNVTFTITWSDPDSTLTRMYVCDSSNITSSGCSGNTYCSTSNAATNPVSCSYTVQESENVEQYWAMLCDDENNCSSTINNTFYVNHAPLVTVTRPLENEDVNQTYGIQFNVSDSDSDNLTATLWYSSVQGAKQNLINSSLNLSDYCSDPDSNTTTTNNCTVFWNTSEIGGNFYLDITVSDLRMNTTNSSERFRVVSVLDNEPPLITDWSITPSLTSGKTALIKVNVTDPFLDKVWVGIRAPDSEQNYTMSIGYDFLYNYSIEVGDTGTYYYKIFANDTMENYNYSMNWVSFTVSTPSASGLTIEAPEKALPSSVIKIQANITVDVLKGVYAFLDASGFNFASVAQNLSVGNITNTARAIWFAAAPDSTGTYTLRANWSDRYGNSWSSSYDSIEITSALGSGALDLSANIVGGTEYQTGETGEISIFLTNSTGSYVTGGSCTVYLYNTTHQLSESGSATELGNGIYYYSFTTQEEGIHTAFADCSYSGSTAYDAHTFHVAPWANQIQTIYNSTIGVGGSIVDFGSGNLTVGTATNIWIKVYNSGNSTADFRVKTQITYSNTIKYSVTDIVSIAPGNKTFNMSEDFTPDVSGLHSIEVTLYSADGTKIYDTHSTTFDVPGILIYDVDVQCLNSTVVPGQYVDANITIWNLGDYYQDVQLNWWIEKDQNYSSGSLPVAVYPNQQRSFVRSLYVPLTAPDGLYYYKSTVSFGSNQSYGYCSFYVSSVETTIPAGIGGGRPTTTVKPEPVMSLLIIKQIQIIPGETRLFSAVLENTGELDLNNITITISGIPDEWITVAPLHLDKLLQGASQTIDISIQMPENETSSKLLTIMVSSDKTTITETVEVVVITKFQQLFNKLEKLIRRAENYRYTLKDADKKGLDASKAEALLDICDEKISDTREMIRKGNYENAEQKIQDIEKYLDDVLTEIEKLGLKVKEKPVIDYLLLAITTILIIFVIILTMILVKLKKLQQTTLTRPTDLSPFERRIQKLRRKLRE
jgi:hypothetical protein